MCGWSENDICRLSWVSLLFKQELVPVVKSSESVGVWRFNRLLNRNVNTEFGYDDCGNIFLHSRRMPGSLVLSGTV